MTPIERIKRSRAMSVHARQMANPRPPAAPFPRNNTGLAILTFAVAPLVYKAVEAPTPQNILGYSVLTGLFGLALFLLSLGLKHQALYDHASVGHPTRVPLKALGIGTFALAAGGLTLFEGGSIVQSAAASFAVAALGLVCFGLDPRTVKGLETEADRNLHRLETLASKVGGKMEALHASISHLAIPEVMPRVRAFDASVNKLLCAVTNDPARAGSVRKYFTVYLDAAVSASEKFAAIHVGTGCPEAQQDYMALLSRLERAFSHRAREYAAAATSDLDIEIEILESYLTQDRLAG